jgi:hypothetical protein
VPFGLSLVSLDKKDMTETDCDVGFQLFKITVHFQGQNPPAPLGKLSTYLYIDSKAPRDPPALCKNCDLRRLTCLLHKTLINIGNTRCNDLGT